MGRRILFISSDVVGDKMAGPAIRAVELARRLAAEHQVTLAAPNRPDLPDLAGASFREGRGAFRRLVADSEIVVTQGLGMPLGPVLGPGHHLVLDFYDPNPVEVLAHFREAARADARRSQDHLAARLAPLARRGDFFLYATERQRDFWLGLLAAHGRLTWEADRGHPNLDDLFAPVPFGLPDDPPRPPDRPVLKGVWPGVGSDDKVLLWGGGIWNWFDPLTVIRGVGLAAAQRPDLRLFFMGVRHPNPLIPAMAMVNRAVELARELNLLDRHVFFNHGWVDYRDRVGFLLESDLAVMAAGADLETRLSFRTRLLDGLWAGLPMIVSAGDYFADLIVDRDLGRVVPVGDAPAFGQAILDLLADPAGLAARRQRVRDAAAGFTWSRVARPLLDYCRQPRRHPGARREWWFQHWALAQYYSRVAHVLLRWGGLGREIHKRLLGRANRRGA